MGEMRQFSTQGRASPPPPSSCFLLQCDIIWGGNLEVISVHSTPAMHDITSEFSQKCHTIADGTLMTQPTDCQSLLANSSPTPNTSYHAPHL